MHCATFTAFFGFIDLPVTLLAKILFTYINGTDFFHIKDVNIFKIYLLFSCIASLISLFGQVFANKSLQYIDLTEISIFKTIDVFF